MKLKIDTHMHTTESDGKGTPYQVVATAVARGLDGVIVTDHDTFRGAILAERARRIQGLNDFIVLYGNEVRARYEEDGETRKADVVLACLEPVGGVPEDIHMLRDIAVENNCITIAVHPFSCFEPAVGKLLYKNPDLFDLVEVWNATTPPLANVRAIRAADRLGKPRTAGSDAHVPSEVAAAYTLVEVEERSRDAVFEALKRGATRPVYGFPGPKALLERIAWSIERRL